VTSPAPRRRRWWPGQWSLARQLLAAQLLVVLLVVAGAATLAYLDARGDSQAAAARRATAIALTVADSPEVRAALGSADPSRVLQPYAEAVRRDTGVDFVVVMAPDRTRYSHPNPEVIGQPFIGTIAPALAGDNLTEVYTGTLGPSVRAVVPVGKPGEIVGLVSVGITTAALGAEVARSIPPLIVAGLALLAVAAVVAAGLSRRLRRVTHGLGAEELARMYRYYDAVLHSAREGIVLLDGAGRVQLANDEARRLLVLPADVVGLPIDQVDLPGALRAAITAGERTDEIHLTAERVVVLSAAPARSGEADVGRIVTVRDHTEVQELAGELDTSRRLYEALRSQAHEAANRLHTVVSLIELGRPDDAVRLATERLSTAQQLADRIVDTVAEPIVAALLLGKSAVAAEQGIDLVVTPDTELDPHVLEQAGVGAGDLVTMLGNLVDNAIDALAGTGAPRRVSVTVREDAGKLLLRVADTGPGLDPAQAELAFRRGWSSKTADAPVHGRGLGLALVGQAVARAGGRIEVERDDGAIFTARIPLRAPAPA